MIVDKTFNYTNTDHVDDDDNTDIYHIMLDLSYLIILHLLIDPQTFLRELIYFLIDNVGVIN